MHMEEPCQGTETVQSDFDRLQKAPSVAIVEAIAAIENVHPTDLPIILHDYIDPQSLDELISSSSEVSVTFSLNQYQIQVSGNTIAVTLC